ncbi:hypothetical protein IIA79_02850 [bacterium]|nr:hypothetical protein [bacterium]
MYKLAIICLALVLAVTAGCQKNSKDETGKKSNDESKVLADTRGDTGIEIARMEAPGGEAPVAEDDNPPAVMSVAPPMSSPEAGIPDEVAVALEEKIIELAPGYGFDHDSDQGTLIAIELPEQRFLVSELSPAIYRELAEKGDPNEAAMQTQAVNEFLNQLSLGVKEAVRQAKAEKQANEDLPAPSTASEPEPEMPIAKDPVGEWRSIGEVRLKDLNYVAQHGDNYYKILLIYFEGKAIFQEFSDGEMVTRLEGTHRYDSETGELKLFDLTGNLMQVIYLKQKEVIEEDENTWVEENRLYAQSSNDYFTTVYEKIGRGGKPMTEEERQRELRRFMKMGGYVAGGGKGK